MDTTTSAWRVAAQTPEHLNRRIHRTTRANIEYYAQHPEQINERLEELDAEWDIERAVESNAATLALAGLILGVLGGRKWLVLPLLVAGFLLQHGVRGWCPPLSLLRRLGFRTPREIEAERYALKAMRGDFSDIQATAQGAQAAAQATGRLNGRE